MKKNNKANFLFLVVTFTFLIILKTVCLHAHFGVLIPSEDIVESKKNASINLKVLFAHPFEGVSMNMHKPPKVGVYYDKNKNDLTEFLRGIDIKLYQDQESSKGWELNYKLKRPGDYIFYSEPHPYWEPEEDCFIIHYTKVVVNAFGMESDWDKEIGLKTEIIPLTRPYGIYTGNVFQGIVKVNGVAVPFSTVEIEYLNEKGELSAPKESFVTQVVKCDGNGVFTYAIPKAGWWGFAALNTDDTTIKYNDEDKDVELGAVLWIKAYDMQ